MKVNIWGRIKFGLRVRPLFLASFIIFSSSLVGVADAATLSFSGGYSSSDNIQVGSIVSLNSKNAQSVVTANINNINNLTGVVIRQNSSNIGFNTTKTSIDVGTSGSYPTDVSTINGNIAKGDRITASIIEGVGQKATVATRVMGTAVSNFDSSSQGAVKETITLGNGKTQTIYAGQILVNVSVADFAGTPISLSDNSSIRPFQSFFSKIVHKTVTQSQTITALVILLISIGISLLLILASTVVSIRSIGRNPLASRGITSHTILIIVMVVAIILISFVASYLVIQG